MSGDDKQLELEALAAAVGEMLLFDQARGNPEEAARILRCARLFARSEDASKSPERQRSCANKNLPLSPSIR
jgi:hypothetical protein